MIGVYQGVEGCHSKLVLGNFFTTLKKDYSTTGMQTFRQVASAVISGKADVGVLPVDNAISGTIREGYDLIAEYDLVPLTEIDWRMDHRLLGIQGASIEGL